MYHLQRKKRVKISMFWKHVRFRYLEPWQIFKIKRFMKIVNLSMPLIISTKHPLRCLTGF